MGILKNIIEDTTWQERIEKELAEGVNTKLANGITTQTVITIIGAKNKQEEKIELAKNIAKEIGSNTAFTTNLEDIENTVFPKWTTVIVPSLTELAVKSTKNNSVMMKVFNKLWKSIRNNHYTIILIHNTLKNKEYAGASAISHETYTILNIDTKTFDRHKNESRPEWKF